MAYTAIDCQGFAGGFTLGVAQAGFNLLGKREMRGGFGVANCEANRHLLPGSWQTEAVEPERWSAPEANMVFGNPPCSGFSVLSKSSFRGADSKINSCMWAFAEFAARVRPEVAIFESVPLAFTQGHDLMKALRARLEELTGTQYTLTHVLHNALSIGGPSMRKRYFWVASRVPFGVEKLPPPDRVPVLRDVIEDLAEQPLDWGPREYAAEPTWYSARQRNGGLVPLVDGHIPLDNPHTKRIQELLEHAKWQPGEYVQSVLRRFYEQNGALPPLWQHSEEKLTRLDFFQGFNTATMWDPGKHARVIAGAGMLNGVHWSAGRTFTHRETARIMGFPDNWLIEPLRGTPGLFLTWGKGITVDCGHWIATWAARALDGEPGTYLGEKIGDREYVVDVTNDWKPVRDTVTTTPKPPRRSPVTEVAEGAEAKPLGRPRPADVTERDGRAFALLTEPKTTEALAAELGVSTKLAYLSLYRLRRDGKVTRVRENGAHVWKLTEFPAAE